MNSHLLFDNINKTKQKQHNLLKVGISNNLFVLSFKFFS